MVAEPVEQINPNVTEVAEPTTPEPVSEPTEDEIPDEAVADFLKAEKILDEGTDESEGAKPAAEEDEVDFSKLTPQQILELGKQKGKSEVQAETQSRAAEYQRQQEEAGVRNALLTSRQRVESILAQAGNNYETISAATQALDQIHGAWNRVLQSETAAAESRALQNFQKLTQDLALQELGTKGKELTAKWNALPDTEKSSAKFFSLYAEEARKGYISQSDVNKLVTEKMAAFIKKLPKSARDAIGFNPPSTKASGGNGVGGPLTEDRARSMSISEARQLLANRAGR